MNLRILSLLALSCSLVAQSPEIYSNGPIITNPTGGFGGGPHSILQSLAPPTGLSHTVFGYTASITFPLADDFAVNGTWLIDAIEVFGYLTGAVAPGATAVNLEILNGPPPAGVPVAGSPGIANNLFTTAGYTVVNTMTGIFRAQDTTPLASNRNVQSIKVSLPAPIVLTTGVYWLRFQYAGISFCPPLSTTWVRQTGNALQSNAGVWNPIVSGTTLPNIQGLPFKLYGISASLPGAITNLGGGCDTATFNVAGSPAVGGYLRAELGNTNPLMFGLIVVGFSNPNAPLFVCGCTSHASLDVVSIGNVFSFEAPMNPAFVGVELFLQGGQLDLVPVGGAPCNLGIQFGLTDGFSWRAY